MKKILLGLVMLLTTATMNAQIELEHVFDGTMRDYETVDKSIWVDNMYVVENLNGSSIDVYNADFSHRANFNINFSKEWGQYIVAQNIFTSDGALCVINPHAKVISIFHENGTVLQNISLEDDDYWYFITKIGSDYKFVVRTSSKTYIYSCPGNGETTTSVENVPAKVKRNAYPNPATDLVTLPYEVDDATSMKIYDMQGKLVERKFLDKSKQELQLNVKDYPSGMYFFEVNGESNSFIVK